MNRAGLERAVAAARLPASLKTYLAAFLSLPAGSALKRRLKADPARQLAGISGVIARAAGLLGVSPEEALFSTGFDAGNLAPARLEAALAELLAAVFLDAEGFTSIRLVPQTRSRTADITAARYGGTYAFEVRCLAGGLPAAKEKALALLEKKYRKKIPQAACSRKKGGLSHCGLVCVAGSGDYAPFRQSADLGGLAAALYEKVGRPGRQHICLISGAETGTFPGWGG